MDSFSQIESRVSSIRIALQDAKDDYTKSISQRSASQREVNELLQRKHAWSPSDLERFTALYRSDHTNEVAESTAQANLVAAERAAEEAANQLSSSILKRYHEEQIWSDKIRRMSTWGTWGLMGVNVLLFLVFQWALEPWRRGRLVRGFEEKVKAVLESEKAKEREGIIIGEDTKLTERRDGKLEEPQLEPTTVDDGTKVPDSSALRASSIPILNMEAADVFIPDTASASAVTDLPASAEPSPLHPLASLSTLLESSRLAIQHLFSTNLISIRQIDLTSARIEGAMAGLAFASIIAALIRATR